MQTVQNDFSAYLQGQKNHVICVYFSLADPNSYASDGVGVEPLFCLSGIVSGVGADYLILHTPDAEPDSIIPFSGIAFIRPGMAPQKRVDLVDGVAKNASTKLHKLQ